MPPLAANVQASPHATPPPPPSREGIVMDIKISKFLKLKPLVFAMEDANDDPQRFLDDSEKVCGALGCSNLRKVELVTYQLRGRADKWWKT